MADLITLAEAKTWLGIKDADTSQDAVLTPLITVATELINDYCETKFEPTAVVKEIQDGRRSDSIFPDYHPIISVEKVVLGCMPDGTAGLELAEGKDYMVRKDEVVLRYLTTPQGRGLVRLDYTYGYAAVPERVKHAAKLTVEAYYRMKTRASVGITSKGKEGETITYDKAYDRNRGLPKEVMGLLGEYRTMEWPGSPMATRNM